MTEERKTTCRSAFVASTLCFYCRVATKSTPSSTVCAIWSVIPDAFFPYQVPYSIISWRVTAVPMHGTDCHSMVCEIPWHCHANISWRCDGRSHGTNMGLPLPYYSWRRQGSDMVDSVLPCMGVDEDSPMAVQPRPPMNRHPYGAVLGLYGIAMATSW